VSPKCSSASTGLPALFEDGKRDIGIALARPRNLAGIVQLLYETRHEPLVCQVSPQQFLKLVDGVRHLGDFSNTSVQPPHTT
jgi:hypothetical protein